MSVTLDAASSADSKANGVTSISHTNLTASGAAVGLLASLVWGGSAITAGSQAVEWDHTGTPQSMTLVPGATVNGTIGNPARLELYGLVSPTPGNKTLFASWTTAAEVCINAISTVGNGVASVATAFPNGTAVTVTTSGTMAVTVTSASGNLTFGLGADAGQVISAPTQTSLYIELGQANTNNAASYGAGAATVTHQWTLGASDTWMTVGCDIAVPPGPTINTDPASQTVLEHATASFSVSATTSGGTLHYQWKKNGVNDGTDSSSYSFTATASDNGDLVTCDVTDNNGTVTSGTALLTVNPTASLGWIHA